MLRRRLDGRTLFRGKRLLRVSALVARVGAVGREIQRWRMYGESNLRWRMLGESNLRRRSRIGAGLLHHTLRAAILDVRRD